VAEVSKQYLPVAEGTHNDTHAVPGFYPTLWRLVRGWLPPREPVVPSL
jgi:hypothetical protein